MLKLYMEATMWERIEWLSGFDYSHGAITKVVVGASVSSTFQREKIYEKKISHKEP